MAAVCQQLANRRGGLKSACPNATSARTGGIAVDFQLSAIVGAGWDRYRAAWRD